MTLKFSVAVRNAELDAIETAVGGTAVLKIFDGTVPAAITDADTGTVLATMTLPADYMNAASNGSKTMLGSWSDSAADAAGTATYFRIFATNGTTQHIQGTVTATGGGGDMTLDNVSIAANQTVTITSFSLTAGNA